MGWGACVCKGGNKKGVEGSSGRIGWEEGQRRRSPSGCEIWRYIDIPESPGVTCKQ